MKIVKALLWIFALIAVLAVAGFFFLVRPQLQFAGIATAYGAKKVCSCRFVADRPLDACKADFMEDVSAATFIEEPNAIRVEILGGRYSDRAVFTPGQGCALVPDGVG